VGGLQFFFQASACINYLPDIKSFWRS